MMYWDSSAIVPLIVAEANTARVRAWLKQDPDPLRAADAGQLGAVRAVDHSPESRILFVCLDETLATAAERDGLRVLGALA